MMANADYTSSPELEKTEGSKTYNNGWRGCRYGGAEYLQTVGDTAAMIIAIYNHKSTGVADFTQSYTPLHGCSRNLKSNRLAPPACVIYNLKFYWFKLWIYWKKLTFKGIIATAHSFTLSLFRFIYLFILEEFDPIRSTLPKRLLSVYLYKELPLVRQILHCFVKFKRQEKENVKIYGLC